MKRILVWITLVAMLFTVMPLASAVPAYTYSKDDVLAAVSGMGRMPANYYNAAGPVLSSISPSMGSAKAKEVTQKLYTLWAFLSARRYDYSGNVSIANALTEEQYKAASAYLWANLGHLNEDATKALDEFLRKTKGSTLVKPGIPNSLLGVKFDEATVGDTAFVKVYTTESTDEVWITDTKGKPISESSTGNLYRGTFANFKEYILQVDYPAAGKNTVQIHGVDASNSSYFFTTTVNVNSPAVSGTNEKGIPANVKKVKIEAARQGTASTFTVTTSDQTDVVKITDSKGKLLAFAYSDEPGDNVFTLSYSFPKAGSYSIRVYAGMEIGSGIQWNKAYKTATVKVTSATSGVAISKVSTTSNVLRGQEMTITVTTSTKVTCVKLLDATNELVDFKATPTSSSKTSRTFKLKYRTNKAGSHKLYVQAGNGIAWSSKKAIVAKVLAPTVTKLTYTKVLRGTPVTINGTTKASTATQARLVDSKGNVLVGPVEIASGSFSLVWDPNPKISGKKVVYAQVYDGMGWSAKKAVTVSFLNPSIKVSATKVKHSKPSTITVKASETVDEVRLYDAKKKLVQSTTERDASGNFVLNYIAYSKGKKTVYLRIHDVIGWSGYIKGSVTFS